MEPFSLQLIGASVSKPHIDEFAVNFPYNIIYLYRTLCRKSLPALILRVLTSCVNSKTIHNKLRVNREKCNHANGLPVRWTMVTTQTETICGPTYSLARAMGEP